MRTLFFATSLLLATSALATDVSGTITSDVTWTRTSSPYTVTADIDVAAKLTIESGVVVRFSAGKKMTVLPNGRLLAVGEVNSKIIFTSTQDVANANPPAAAGDWGYLSIQGGQPFAEPSLLNHLQIRYGKALRLISASPRINNVSFENNLEAAILSDLSSSPVGEGLSGIGNGVNGIRVPAGEVVSGLRFALKGLPYVVNDGILHVGAKPPELEFSPRFINISPGGSAQVILEFRDPATSAFNMTFQSSDSSKVPAPPSVAVAVGETTIPLTLSGLAPGSATLTANTPFGSAQIDATVAALPSLTLEAVTPFKGRTTIARVVVSGSAPSSGVTVSLVSSAPSVISVPASVLIPSGQNSAELVLSSLDVGSATISATAPGFTDGARTYVVLAPTLSAPSPIAVPLAVRNLIVTLSPSAPPGGLTFNLQSSDPSVVTVPATRQVPAGEASVTVPLTGVAEGLSQITVSHPDYVSAESTAIVQRIALSTAPSAISIPKNLTASVVLQLSQPAPVGGLNVAVSSSDSSVFSVATTNVVFAPNELSKTVVINALTEGNAQLLASAPNSTAVSAPVAVTQRAKLHFVQPTYTVGQGLIANQVGIQLLSGSVAYVPNQSIQVSLSGSNPAALSIPKSIELSTNQPVTYFAMRGVSTAQALTVNADAGASIDTADPMSVSIVPATVEFPGLDGVRGIASNRDDFFVRISVPSSTEIAQSLPSASRIASISVVEANPSNVVPGIFENSTGSGVASTVNFFASSQSNQLFVGSPTALGSYRVRVSISGVGDFDSPTQSVEGFSLKFNRTSVRVGKGLSLQNAIQVQRMNGSQPIATGGALPVTVTASDTSKVSVFNVTIPDGQASAFLILHGLELSNRTDVLANAPGFAQSTPLEVEVVEPSLEFAQLPTDVTVLSARKEFCVGMRATGSEFPNQIPVALTLDLAIDSATPANIVDGFYASPSATAPITQMTNQFPQANLCAWVGAPSAIGSYRIKILLPGNPNSPWLSEPISVTPNQISFAQESANVSVGLRVPLSLSTPEPNPSGGEITLSCTPPAQCATQVLQMPSGGRQVEARVVGLAAGSAVLTASSVTLAEDTLALDVVPFTAEFFDWGKESCNECPFGWAINFVSPGVADSQIEAALELIEQTPPGVAVVDPVTYIEEGARSSSPEGYSSFEIAHILPGSFKIRATLPGLGVLTSPTIRNDIFGPRYACPTPQIGVGTTTPVQLSVLAPSQSPTTMNFSCLDSSVCGTISPTLIPEGEASAVFPVIGNQLGNTSLTVSGAPFQTSVVPISVVPPQARFDSNSNPSVGTSATVVIRLDPLPQPYYCSSFMQPTATAPITIALSTSIPGRIQFPATVTIPAGSSSISFTIQGLQPGTVNLMANWPQLAAPIVQTVQVFP